jgi:hypothetical protein
MDNGRLVTEGPIDELLSRFAMPLYRLEPEPGQEGAVAALVTRFRETPWIDGVREDGGRVVVSVSDEAAASAGLLPIVVAGGVRLAAFERVRPTLEDVFLRLVGRGTGEVAA